MWQAPECVENPRHSAIFLSTLKALMLDPLAAGGQRLSSAEESRDEELMIRLHANDPAALDELLRLYWTSIVGYADRLLRSADAAEDVAQQTFIQLWQRRSSWRAGGSVRGYLFRVAHNLILNNKRRQSVRDRWREAFRREESHRPATPEQLAVGHQLEVAVEIALARLPSRRREVFELVRFHGLSYREVGEVMGISPQTVANQMSTALSELRNCLASYLNEPSARELRVLPTAPDASTTAVSSSGEKRQAG